MCKWLQVTTCMELITSFNACKCNDTVNIDTWISNMHTECKGINFPWLDAVCRKGHHTFLLSNDIMLTST